MLSRSINRRSVFAEQAGRILLKGMPAHYILALIVNAWLSGLVLAQLSPVIITSPQTSDAVMYNGLQWVNKPQVFNVKAFGALGDGSTNDRPAIQAAIAAAAASPNGTGGWVEFPPGTYMINSRLTLPTWVSLRGQGRASIIRTMGGYSDTRMIVASNSNLPMFNSRIVDMWFDWESRNVANSAVIEAVGWQENCGLEHVVISEFNNIGVYINDGTPGTGAAYLKFRDIELFASESFANTVGIRVDQISSVGAFVLDVEGATIGGGSPTNLMSHAIDMANDSAVIKGLHIELCANGVHAGTNGKITMISCTGAVNNSVNSLCKVESNFNGTVAMMGCQRNGANYLINNLLSGEQINTDPPVYSYPTATAPNTAKHWVTFAGSNGAVQQSSGGVTVVRHSSGDYTITWPQAFANTNYCYSVMHSAGSLALTQEYSKSASALRLRTQTWSGASGSSAAMTSPTQVYVVAYAVR